MENFSLDKSLEILERTPGVISNMLENLSGFWIHNNEGPDSWSPYDIVGHLIHGEKTDWIPRIKIILEYGEERPFEPFDRFAQFQDFTDKKLDQLLKEFHQLRSENIETFRKLNLDTDDLDKSGIHPDFGPVTLQELIAAWVVHDLSHIRQIGRVMAKQYKSEVGPWEAYLPVLNE